MQLVLLGGAPGVGKSTAANYLLEEVYRRGGDVLVQWVEIEALWRHQPWRINSRTSRLRDENLRAVLANAQRAGVDYVVLTWVFPTVEQYDLVRALAPEGAGVMTVQLTATEATWRQRFASDRLRNPITDIDVKRWADHSTVGSDHVIATDGLDAAAVGQLLADRILGPPA